MYVGFRSTYSENGHAEELRELACGSMPFEGTLEVAPVPELVDDLRGAAVDLQYLEGEAAREGRREGRLRRLRRLLRRVKHSQLRRQGCLQEHVVAPSPLSYLCCCYLFCTCSCKPDIYMYMQANYLNYQLSFILGCVWFHVKEGRK